MSNDFPANVPADSIYRYIPSHPLAIAAAAVFGILGIVHLVTLIRLKCKYFLPVVIGAFMEVVGYAVRIPSGNSPGDVGLYATQTLFILLPPLLFAASIYMTLGRTLRYIGAEHLSLVPVRWLTGFFVTGDIIAFFAQCAGGGMQAIDDEDIARIGETVAEAGLGVQLAFFSFFIVVSAISHFRLARDERRRGHKSIHNWRRVLLCLYLTSLLILVRSVFRLLEFVTGYNGTVMRHEWMLYVFDGLMMAFALVVLQLLHPAYVIGNGRTRVVEEDQSVLMSYQNTKYAA